MNPKLPQSLRDLWSIAFSKKSNRRAYASLVVLLFVMLFGYQNCSNGFQVLEGTANFASKSADPSIAGACVSGTTQNCAFNNGLGTQTCNQEGTGFGPCQLTSCNPAFNFQNGVCIPNACAPGTVTACAANNGTGTQTCNAQGTGPGACMITACNEGYRLVGGQCEKIPPTKYVLDDCYILSEGLCRMAAYSIKDGVLKSQMLLENDPNSPAKVELSSGVTDFSSYYGTACAVVNGALKCWGDNRSCRTGVNDGSFTRVAAPTTVIASGVTAVSVGMFHTCAIVNGGLQCFGGNYSGQLGNGLVAGSATDMNRDCGIKTAITSGVTAVSSSHTQTCAVVNGSAQCWGNAGAFQEGEGTNVRSPVPVVMIPNGVQKVFAGHWAHNPYTHACAISPTGALSCFGANASGQVGDGKGGNLIRYSPPSTIFSSGVTDIGGASLHTCAVVNGALKCWGYAYGWAYGLPGAQIINAFFNTPQTIIEGGVAQILTGTTAECAVVGKILKCFGGDKVKPPTTHNLE